MSKYSTESSEEMRAALLDIMAIWENPVQLASEAGELMYQRAREALAPRALFPRLAAVRDDMEGQS